ncbi:MAG: glycosyltransferase [Sphingobacterium sp.]
MSDIKQNRTLTPGVSIIICTYNGAQKLPKTIQALADQNVPDNIPWEIIFVDNNSSDNSQTVAKMNWNNLPQTAKIPFISLSETKIGKYHAFNTAILRASFSYFVIVDDDNILRPDYIRQAFELIHHQPNIGAIGSKTEAVFEKHHPPIPKWFVNDAERYAIGEQGDEGDVTCRKHLWGAGMVSRTQLYRDFYEKYPSFLITHTTKNILVAEDTEYCLRLVLRGFKLYYSPKLVLQHFVPNERLSIDYWEKLNYNIDNSFDVIDAYYMAAKVHSDKYKTSFEKLRLKMLTKLRVRIYSGIKKTRQKILLGLLFPTSSFNSPLTNDVNKFISDPALPKNE